MEGAMKLISIILILGIILTGILLLKRIHPPKEDLTVNLPELEENSHAMIRHNSQARAAWEFVKNYGKYCQYNCSDGRIRFVCGIPDNSGLFAIVVIEIHNGISNLITSFLADQNYAYDIINDPGCKPRWNFAHP